MGTAREREHFNNYRADPSLHVLYTIKSSPSSPSARLDPTFNTDPQSRLWSSCNDTSELLDSGIYVQLCNGGVANLVNISGLVDPFLTYLPSGFSTGLVKQFSPRMNSTVTRNDITASELPADCGSLPGAFYVHYSHAGNWSLMARMPANQIISPWQATRDRQDISERLYINISVELYNHREPIGGFLEITLNSILGYFELPNYSNGQKPGPPLAKYPWLPTDLGYIPREFPSIFGYYRRDLSNGSAGMTNSSVVLQTVPNKGPFLNIAMALFGENSFIANRFQNPWFFIETYAYESLPRNFLHKD